MASSTLPAVRPNLRYTRLEQDGKILYVVKDPVSTKYFRFGEMETWLMQQLDGTRTFAQVATELKAAKGKGASPTAVESFYLRLKEIGLTERTVAEKSLLLMEKLRSMRKARLEAPKNTLMRMRFSWGDPDQLFNHMLPWVRFFWTRGFVMVSAVVFLLYAFILVTNWDLFKTGFSTLYNPSTYTPGFIIAIYTTGFFIFLMHEFGHGLTCKRFGGEVHEIGMMLLYFTPAFYCNVNDAWTFEKRSHRLWVTFAGGWIQLFIAALAAMIWAMTEPESSVHRIAFVATLLGGGFSVLINYNPLLPLDGYYALVDWLGLPNLRQRAFAMLGAVMKKYVMRMDATIPAATPRERRILLIYGALAMAYSIFVLWVVAHWLGSMLVSKFGGWGWVLFGLVLWRLTRKTRGKLMRIQGDVMADKLSTPRARRIMGWAGAAAAVVLVSAFFVPWTVRVKGTATLEPGVRGWLRPAEAGWVESVLVREGEKVRAGQPLIALRDPGLTLQLTRARAAVRALEREAAASRAATGRGASGVAEVELGGARRELAELERREAALVLRAPFNGVVATPRTEQLVGAKVVKGDSLLEVWSDGPMRARIILTQRDAGDVAVGDRVRLRFSARPDWIFQTEVNAIGAAARQEHYEIFAPMRFPDAQSELRPGLLGQAKVAVDRMTVARATARGLRRMIRTERFL